MMRTLFLHPPSFDGFDGGAGSRYQARREIRSFWYPTWLAQPAALVDGSKLIDAPPARLGLEAVLKQAAGCEFCDRDPGGGRSVVKRGAGKRNSYPSRPSFGAALLWAGGPRPIPCADVDPDSGEPVRLTSRFLPFNSGRSATRPFSCLTASAWRRGRFVPQTGRAWPDQAGEEVQCHDQVAGNKAPVAPAVRHRRNGDEPAVPRQKKPNYTITGGL